MQTNKVNLYLRLMRLDKPIGILLLMWPTLWALWLAANGLPPIPILLIFIAGVILMRSAGCVINDLVDQHFDIHVQRTQHRPIASGRVSTSEALLLFTGLCIVAFSLVLLLNRFCMLLACLGLMLASSYPYMKRITYLPQGWLGLAFAWGVPMAWAAVNHDLTIQCGILFIATAAWIVAYDTQYALADKADDIKIGVKSSAILFGRWVMLWIVLFQLLFIAGLAWVGWQKQLGQSFYLSLVGATLLFSYQYKLTKAQQPQRCFQAFLNNQWVGLTLFLGIILSGLRF